MKRQVLTGLYVCVQVSMLLIPEQVCVMDTKRLICCLTVIHKEDVN